MINRFLVTLNPKLTSYQGCWNKECYKQDLWLFSHQDLMVSTPAPICRTPSTTIEAVADREGIYRTQCRGIPKPCSICGWELARVVCAKIYGPHRPFSSDKWVATEETWILLWEIITTARNLDSFIKSTRLIDTNIFELLLLNMN